MRKFHRCNDSGMSKCCPCLKGCVDFWICVLSAYLWNLKLCLSVILENGWMHKESNTGPPRTYPWGTPYFKSFCLDTLSLIILIVFFQTSKVQTRLKQFPTGWSIHLIVIWISWSIMSNAKERLSSARIENCPLSAKISLDFKKGCLSTVFFFISWLTFCKRGLRPQVTFERDQWLPFRKLLRQ